MENLPLNVKAAHPQKEDVPLYFAGLHFQFVWVVLFAAKALGSVTHCGQAPGKRAIFCHWIRVSLLLRPGDAHYYMIPDCNRVTWSLEVGTVV